MSLNTMYHLVCSNNLCSFRVHDRYFQDKSRFEPGICPNCGGVVQVHVAYGPVDPDMTIGIDPSQPGYRSVINVRTGRAPIVTAGPEVSE